MVKEYVNVRNVTYDSIEKVISFLLDSTHENAAYLSHYGESEFLLLYEGNIKVDVLNLCLNFNSNEKNKSVIEKTKTLFWDMFKPFLNNEGYIIEDFSFIAIAYDNEKDDFHLIMYLFFRGMENYRKVFSLLEEAKDDVSVGEAAWFGLD